MTSLRHERVNLDPFLRFLLVQLDGTNTLGDLRAALEQAAGDGRLVPREPEKSGASLDGDLEHALAWLACAAVLEA